MLPITEVIGGVAKAAKVSATAFSVMDSLANENYGSAYQTATGIMLNDARKNASMQLENQRHDNRMKVLDKKLQNLERSAQLYGQIARENIDIDQRDTMARDMAIPFETNYPNLNPMARLSSDNPNHYKINQGSPFDV